MLMKSNGVTKDERLPLTSMSRPALLARVVIFAQSVIIFRKYVLNANRG